MDRYIPVVTASSVRKILLGDILYIMKKNRKIQIVTQTDTYEYYEKMENVLEILDRRFYACLQGCIVNLDAVERVENQTVYFAQGHRISMGRDSYIRTKQYYTAYIKNFYKRQ